MRPQDEAVVNSHGPRLVLICNAFFVFGLDFGQPLCCRVPAWHIGVNLGVDMSSEHVLVTVWLDSTLWIA